MRYAVVAASLLAGCICWADVSRAQEACVSAPNGAIVCGPIVQPNFGQPNYGPPTRPNYAPRRNFEERRDYEENERPDDRRGERPDVRRSVPPDVRAPGANGRTRVVTEILGAGPTLAPVMVALTRCRMANAGRTFGAEPTRPTFSMATVDIAGPGPRTK